MKNSAGKKKIWKKEGRKRKIRIFSSREIKRAGLKAPLALLSSAAAVIAEQAIAPSVAIAAEKQKENDPAAVVAAVISASVAPSIAAAGQKDDDPDPVKSTSVIVVTSASTVCCS